MGRGPNPRDELSTVKLGWGMHVVSQRTLQQPGSRNPAGYRNLGSQDGIRSQENGADHDMERGLPLST